MNEKELLRELSCCTHEAAFGEDVYRSQEHWERAGKPYEMNLRKQREPGSGQGFVWPAYFDLTAPARWTRVPEWTGASSALVLIEAVMSPHYARTVGREAWSPHYALVHQYGRWGVFWMPGGVYVSVARTPGAAVCLAVLKRVDAHLQKREALSDEAVEQFRPLFTFD